jgi:hypothetical protein
MGCCANNRPNNQRKDTRHTNQPEVVPKGEEGELRRAAEDIPDIIMALDSGLPRS